MLIATCSYYVIKTKCSGDNLSGECMEAISHVLSWSSVLKFLESIFAKKIGYLCLTPIAPLVHEIIMKPM